MKLLLPYLLIWEILKRYRVSKTRLVAGPGKYKVGWFSFVFKFQPCTANTAFHRLSSTAPKRWFLPTHFPIPANIDSYIDSSQSAYSVAHKKAFRMPSLGRPTIAGKGVLGGKSRPGIGHARPAMKRHRYVTLCSTVFLNVAIQIFGV